MNKKERKAWSQNRSQVIKEIEKLDKRYGKSLVNSAFTVRITKDRLEKKLLFQKREIEEKISRLK